MDIKAFRGLSGTYNVRASERDRAAPRNIECLVQFLNNTQHTFIIDRRSKGQFLLDCVFKYLNLIETDFFGLKFTPQESHSEHSINQPHSQPQIIAITNNSVALSNKAQSLNSYDNSPASITSLSSSSAVNAVASDNYNATIAPAVITSTSKSATTTPVVSNILNNCNNSNNYCTPINNNNNNNYSHASSVNEYSPKEVCGKQDENISPTLHEECWLDPTKSIRKQYKSGPPYKFYFRVKFYVSDPSKLADDTTRNHLYLQLRQDILRKRLVVPPCSAILLASYILQSEVGDWKQELLEKDYASDFRLLPNQNDDIKEKVIKLHRRHKSLSPADAEYQFLDHAAKQLDCYGVEFFDARDSSKDDVLLGVSSNGLVVFKGSEKVSQFSWAKIIKIMFKKKIFSIQLRRCEGVTCDNFIEFNLLSNQACKIFWEECVAQHSFFRLHQPKSPPKKFFSFLNFGSKFQYSGKTEYQTMEESRKRSFSHFSRTPSKRYARRTIPIGRPSWSDSQDNKRVSEGDDSNKSSRARNTRDIDGSSNNNGVESNVSTWIYAAPASSGATVITDRFTSDITPNGSTDPKSPAYRPKSLTLKSFMYIDESKNVPSVEHDKRNLEPSDEISSATYCQTDSSQSTSIKQPGAFKKDLKRSESLRISNSIKGALSLTKKAGVSSGSQLARISESIRDKFLAGKSKPRKLAKTIHEEPLDEDSDLDSHGDRSFKVVSIAPGKDGKFGFKIREITITRSSMTGSKTKKVKEKSIIIYDVSPNSPAALCNPKLSEGDQIIEINGVLVDGLSESKVEALIKGVHHQKPPTLTLYIISRTRLDCASVDSSCSQSEVNSRSSPVSAAPSSQNDEVRTLAESIKHIKQGLQNKDLIQDFEKLSRRKEDESLDESKSMENIDKNRYRDILPYDSTRVLLLDAMSGDYINASFVDMPVPSGQTNRYIATQGPLSSTCEDFWQMVWEQNCSLIIMVTPLIEAGRVKCHKYWPDEKEDVRHGQLLVRNIGEKSRAATIDRTIQLVDIKSDKKRTTTQIQYRAWPDHEIPEDCSDFLKLVKRVRKHRAGKPQDPIVVHCSAGIGRTGVLILMETAICIMESGEPVYPIKILEEMRKQRAMLIQTNSQFQFVSDAICKVYDQKLYKRSHKHRKE